jgi:bifunctional non-homologous end joining protein LigD
VARSKQTILEAAGREVAITNPDKVLFPAAGHTKLDLARYYLAVAAPALQAAGGRPIVLKRYVNGIGGEFFYQKRAPEKRPDWIETVELKFPSGRTAHEIVLHDAAQLLWIVNLATIDLHPHPVRADDVEHPDELRVDLDPGTGFGWPEVCKVALVSRAVLEEHGLIGWPKTSGSRGMHVNVRLEPRWGFDDVRRAALAIAREVERRAPDLATSRWWKEERHGIFLDYNQNAKDRTVAAAWSVRPVADARVSMPLTWDQVEGSDPAAFNLATVPALYAERGDPAAGIDGAPCSLDSILALAAQQEESQGDAPWPPHYSKQSNEPPRVSPSRRRQPIHPLVVVSKAAKEEEARAGLERWKARHPEAASHLEPADILVDAMRGRHTTWTRIRVNLRHVPEEQRPAEEPPDPDYDPWHRG